MSTQERTQVKSWDYKSLFHVSIAGISGLILSFYLLWRDRYRPIQRRDILEQPINSCLVPATDPNDTLFFDWHGQGWSLPNNDYHFFTPDGRTFKCLAGEEFGQEIILPIDPNTQYFDRQTQEIITDDEYYLKCVENNHHWILNADDEKRTTILCTGHRPRLYDTEMLNFIVGRNNETKEPEILPKTICFNENRGTRKRINRIDYESFINKRPRLENNLANGGDAYFVCDGNDFIESIQTCGVTGIFDEDNQTCIEIDYCEGMPDGLIHSYIPPAPADQTPLAENEYFICSNNESLRRQCTGENQIFDWSLSRCRDLGICAGLVGGTLLPVEGSPTQYIECLISGQERLRTCPINTVFDNDRQQCSHSDCLSLNSDGKIVPIPFENWIRSNTYNICSNGMFNVQTVQQPENVDSLAQLNELDFRSKHLRSIFPDVVLEKLQFGFPSFINIFDETTQTERPLDFELDFQEGAGLSLSVTTTENWPLLSFTDIGVLYSNGNFEWNNELEKWSVNERIKDWRYAEVTSDTILPIVFFPTEHDNSQQQLWSEAVRNPEIQKCEKIFNTENYNCSNEPNSIEWPYVFLNNTERDSASILRELLVPNFLFYNDENVHIRPFINQTRLETIETYTPETGYIFRNSNFGKWHNETDGPILRTTKFRFNVNNNTILKLNTGSDETQEIECSSGTRLLSSELPFCVPDTADANDCIRDAPMILQRQIAELEQQPIGWQYFTDDLKTLISCGTGWTTGIESDQWINRMTMCENNLIFNPLTEECEENSDSICQHFSTIFIPRTAQFLDCSSGTPKYLRGDLPNIPINQLNAYRECAIYTFDLENNTPVCLTEEEVTELDNIIIVGRAALYPSLWNSEN